MKTLKIAVVGAGFCGMASAYYLSKYFNKGVDLEITILDPGEVGENASGISAGLLHPYTGAHAKLKKNGIEGQASTLELANVAKKALGYSVAEKMGLLRVAISEQQKQDFSACASKYEDVEWCGVQECQKLFPSMVSEPGIFIRNAYTIHTKQYLKGLWKACKESGVLWSKNKPAALSELGGYDAIIVAAGANVTSFPELSHLPVQPIKGQILEIRWPEKIAAPMTPISSKAYIVPGTNPDNRLIGATFERNFKCDKPDIETALRYLMPKMTDLFPGLKDAEILACHSGIRASAPNHMPLCKRETKNIWVITGMGSKGLLFHALYSKKLVAEVMNTLAPLLTSRYNSTLDE